MHLFRIFLHFLSSGRNPENSGKGGIRPLPWFGLATGNEELPHFLKVGDWYKEQIFVRYLTGDGEVSIQQLTTCWTINPS